MRRPLSILTGLFVAGALATLVAGERPSVVSGRAVGEITPSFVVLDVTGPHKGEAVCYVCEYRGAPTILAFFRDGGDQTADLIGKLNALAKRQQGLKVVAVMTSGSDREGWLRQLAQASAITMPLTVFRGGTDDRAMKLYKLNGEAANTILVSTKRKVTANLTDVTADQFALVEQEALKVLPSR